jgi:hypothetical protein
MIACFSDVSRWVTKVTKMTKYGGVLTQSQFFKNIFVCATENRDADFTSDFTKNLVTWSPSTTLYLNYMYYITIMIRSISKRAGD